MAPQPDETRLIKATTDGDVDLVRELLAAGVDPICPCEPTPGGRLIASLTTRSAAFALLNTNESLDVD